MPRVKRPAKRAPLAVRRSGRRRTRNGEPMDIDVPPVNPNPEQNPIPPSNPTPEEPPPPPTVTPPPPTSSTPPPPKPPTPKKIYHAQDLNLTPRPSPMMEEMSETPSPDLALNPLAMVSYNTTATVETIPVTSKRPATSGGTAAMGGDATEQAPATGEGGTAANVETPATEETIQVGVEEEPATNPIPPTSANTIPATFAATTITEPSTQPSVLVNEEEVLSVLPLRSFSYIEGLSTSVSTETEGNTRLINSSDCYEILWKDGCEIEYFNVQVNQGIDPSVYERVNEEFATDLGEGLDTNTTNQDVDNTKSVIPSSVQQDPPVVVEKQKKKTSLGKKHAKKSKPKSKASSSSNPREPPVAKEKQTRSSIQKAKAAKQQAVDAAASGVHSDEESDESILQPRPILPLDGFTCKEAMKRFQILRKKKLLFDKGFPKKSMEDLEFIGDVVHAHGWDDFCKIKAGVNTTVVRELYAEAYCANSTVIPVRGVDVNISPEAINAMLGLTPPAFTQHEDLLHNATEEALDAMVTELGKPGAKWEFHTDFSLRVFRANKLTPEANVWVNFVKNSLYPTTHDSTLNKDRVVLLYSVMVGNSVNVGELAHESILYCCKRNQGPLYLPGLIHLLCKASGVPEYRNDIIENNKGDKWTIDLKTVARLGERGEVRNESVLVRMLEDLTAQSSSVLDCVVAQGSKFEAMMEDLREDWAVKMKEWDEKADERSEKLKTEVGVSKNKIRMMKVKVRDLKLKNRKLVAKNKKLQRKLQERKAAASAAAAASTSTV